MIFTTGPSLGGTPPSGVHDDSTIDGDFFSTKNPKQINSCIFKKK